MARRKMSEDERVVAKARADERRKAYKQTPEYKAYNKAYSKVYRDTTEFKSRLHSPEFKDRQSSYRNTPQSKENKSKYNCEYRKDARNLEKERLRKQTPEYKEKARLHKQTIEQKEKARKRGQTPECKEKARKRRQTPEYKSIIAKCVKRWRLSPRGIAFYKAYKQLLKQKEQDRNSRIRRYYSKKATSAHFQLLAAGAAISRISNQPPTLCKASK